jgi:hypothetical protein
MIQRRYINELVSNHFPFIDKDKTSFIYSYCNLPDIIANNRDYPLHTFSEYSSLYGHPLYQGIFFSKFNFTVRCFYVLYKTEIEYYSGSVAYNNTIDYHERSEILELNNRILEPDYPKLEKLIKKAKSLAPFL